MPSFMTPAPTYRSTPLTTNISSKINKDANNGIWASLLDSVSSDKQLDERTLVMLGGTAESQNDFLVAISKENASSPNSVATFGQKRHLRDKPQRKLPPIANQFALGYTYQDVIGADQDDILCRLHVYMLADTRPMFAPLLTPLFTPHTLPSMLVVILLDWQEPWHWLRQLRERVRLIRSILQSKDIDCKDIMDENMECWRERRRGPASEDGASKPTEFTQPFPLGPGEWDEPLGVPLCVVCHNVERVNVLECEYVWKDREFDIVMQFLRTTLLKHGASLIYTSPENSGSLQTLIRSSLDIQSFQKKTALKRNVTDRENVLIPPNWDSWGNIRAQCDGFDVERVSATWSLDIQLASAIKTFSNGLAHDGIELSSIGNAPETDVDTNGTVALYEQAVPNPQYRPLGSVAPVEPVLICPDYQEFLIEQAARLQKYKARDEAAAQRGTPKKPITRYPPGHTEVGYVDDHLGPIQFNVGGIQVDAEVAIEALQRRTARRVANERQSETDDPVADERLDDEKMRAFFTGLKVEGKPSNNASRE